MAMAYAVPEAMVYGAMVFAPFGSEHIPQGIIAGLIALFCANFFAIVPAGVRNLVNMPDPMLALMMVAFSTTLATSHPDATFGSILILLFFIVFLCGIFQILFGFLKVGVLVKYIPYPVTAGLFNGMAIVLFLHQVHPMLGFESSHASLDFDHIQIHTFMTGLLTILAIVLTPKISTKIPAPLFGILIGTLIYYVVVLIGQGSHLGATVGAIPTGIPSPHYAVDFFRLLSSASLGPLLIEVTPMALGLATMASLKSLIVSVTADNLLRERSNSNQELIKQGIGNLTSSLFGGIPIAGDRTGTSAMFEFGGRSTYSRVFGGVMVLVIVLFLTPLLSPIPQVVLSGLLVVVAFHSFDRWSIALLPKLAEKKDRLQVIADITVIALVMCVFGFVDILIAISAGVLISIIFFMVRMSKDIIRRQYDASRIRSNIYRSDKEIRFLEESGKKIQVYELEGSLFFGTADKLANTIEKILPLDVNTIIVDLTHISDVDSTGTQILMRIRDRTLSKNKQLFLSSVDIIRDDRSLADFLPKLSTTADSDQFVFETLDDALGRAEDALLDEGFGADRYDIRLPLAEVDLFKDYSDRELEVLGEYLETVEHSPGEAIFRQGDKGDRLCILVRGRVDIVIDLPDGKAQKKLLSLCAGTIFGEMAIIDKGPRAASVVPSTDITTHHLLESELSRLRKDYPELEHRLSMGLAKELSKRLRIANRVITEHKS